MLGSFPEFCFNFTKGSATKYKGKNQISDFCNLQKKNIDKSFPLTQIPILLSEMVLMSMFVKTMAYVIYNKMPQNDYFSPFLVILWRTAFAIFEANIGMMGIKRIVSDGIMNIWGLTKIFYLKNAKNCF